MTTEERVRAALCDKTKAWELGNSVKAILALPEFAVARAAVEFVKVEESWMSMDVEVNRRLRAAVAELEEKPK